jgi:hypothetical protein
MPHEQIPDSVAIMSKPVTTIRNPPANEKDRNGGGDGPEKRQRKIDDQPENYEDHPEDFALHINSQPGFFAEGAGPEF